MGIEPMDRPLLMNAAMVRAVLSGQKTQTRRPIKDGPEWRDGGRWTWTASSTDRKAEACFNYSYPDPNGNTYADRGPEKTVFSKRCPMGLAGDRLWVRETWDWRDWQSCQDGKIRIAYAADGEQVDRIAPPDWNPTIYNAERWRPSIHMPRWACRLVLPLVKVRIERVQDITEEDAKAEGVEPVLMRGIGSYPEWMRPTMREVGGHQKAFELLWKQIYGDASWDANPWVWVAEWKDIEART